MGRKTYWGYIMANPTHTALNTGVTSNLPRRVWQHRTGSAGDFTAKYSACLLVYFEEVDDATSAITREKQLKVGSRQRKLALINSRNPAWRDLYEDIR
jgi:putative endonuclease